MRPSATPIVGGGCTPPPPSPPRSGHVLAAGVHVVRPPPRVSSIPVSHRREHSCETEILSPPLPAPGFPHATLDNLSYRMDNVLSPHRDVVSSISELARDRSISPPSRISAGPRFGVSTMQNAGSYVDYARPLGGSYSSCDSQGLTGGNMYAGSFVGAPPGNPLPPTSVVAPRQATILHPDTVRSQAAPPPYGQTTCIR